jgi:hypothetical protein
MPNRENLNQLSLLRYAVEYPVIAADNLSVTAAGTSRIRWANERERPQCLYMINDFTAHAPGSGWIVPRNVRDNLL